MADRRQVAFATGEDRLAVLAFLVGDDHRQRDPCIGWLVSLPGLYTFGAQSRSTPLGARRDVCRGYWVLAMDSLAAKGGG